MSETEAPNAETDEDVAEELEAAEAEETEAAPEAEESEEAEDATDADADAEAEADAAEADEESNSAAEPETVDGDVMPIGVKLGSTRTVLTTPDGTVRTLTCLATYEDALTGEERALYGEQAATEYPDNVQFMLRSGLPEDDDRAELAGRFFREFLDANDAGENSVVVYAVPTIDNERGLENLADVVENSDIGDRHIRSYPESLCGAVSAMGDDMEAIEQIFVGINMGSTNLEACAYRRGEQLNRFATGGVTGNEVDRRIANFVEEETQGRVNIDLTTAREYKETHGDMHNFEPFTDVIQQPGGGSHEFTIEHSVVDALDEYVDEAVDEIANTFLPQLANDYMKTYKLALDAPIVITGGMACVPGLVEEFETRLSAELQRDVEVIAPDEPVTAAATGAQRIAARLVESESY